MVGLSARVCHLRQKLSPLAGAKQSPPYSQEAHFCARALLAPIHKNSRAVAWHCAVAQMLRVTTYSWYSLQHFCPLW